MWPYQKAWLKYGSSNKLCDSLITIVPVKKWDTHFRDKNIGMPNHYTNRNFNDITFENVDFIMEPVAPLQ